MRDPGRSSGIAHHDLDRRLYRLFYATIVAVLLVGFAASLAVFFHFDVRVDFATFGNINILIGFCLAPFFAFYISVRFDARLSSLLGSFCVLSLLPPALCMLTYATTMLGGGLPLRDGLLAAADRSLGFDWVRLMVLADSAPGVAKVGRWAYASILEQTGFCALALTASGQFERLQLFIMAAAIDCIACAVVSGLLPALGTYAHFGIDPLAHPHLPLVTQAFPVPEVLALRGGTFNRFSMDTAQGIITFPSFHAGLGVLFAWATWRVPGLRWAMLALNAVLILATPLEGSHYLADVIAGMAVAVGALALTRGFHRALADRLRPVTDGSARLGV